MHDKLVKKFNAIDTCKLVSETDYYSKISDIEGEIPGITCLETTAALTTVEKNIPSVDDI